MLSGNTWKRNTTLFTVMMLSPLSSRYPLYFMGLSFTERGACVCEVSIQSMSAVNWIWKRVRSGEEEDEEEADVGSSGGGIIFSSSSESSDAGCSGLTPER